jgi:hypothetical protein
LRLSSVKGDRGYVLPFLSTAQVFFTPKGATERVQLTNCETADEEKGTVVLLQRKKHWLTRRMVTTRVTYSGKVEIVLPPQAKYPKAL